MERQPAHDRKNQMIVIKRIVVVSSLVFLCACAGKTALHEAGSAKFLPSFSGEAERGGPAEGFRAVLEAYEAGKMNAVLRHAQQVETHYPGTPWARRSLFLSERALIALGRTAEADAVMERVVREYPELADYALFFLAEHYFSLKQHAEAAVLYRRLIDDYPGSFWREQALETEAKALFEAKWYYRSAEAFKQFQKEYPRSAFCPEAGLGAARSLAAAGDVRGAVSAYRRVFVEYPGKSVDRKVERALSALKRKGAKVPELTPDELYQRGKKLLRAKEYKKAHAAFTTLLAREPDYPNKVDVLYRTGLSLYYLRRRSEAAAVLEQIVQEYPSARRSPDALKWLGKTYGRLGKAEKAINSYLKIVSSYPRSKRADDALYVIGNIYRDTDSTKAMHYFDQLVRRYPRSKFADSSIWWIAWTHYMNGDLHQAEETLDGLIRKYPRSFLNHQARYWLGRITEKKGEQAGAAAFYQDVLARAPYTYYGYLAAERLAYLKFPVLAVTMDADAAQYDSEKANEDADQEALGDPDELSAAERPREWTDEALQTLSANPTFTKALELTYLNMKDEAAAELWTLQKKIPKKHGSLLGISKAFFELEDYNRSLTLVLRNYNRYLKRGVRGTPEDFWLLAYPRAYWDTIVAHARRYNQDPYFIAAIIREESRFHAEAQSPAGARGVMQVMPSTGRWVAQMIRLRGFQRKQLFDHETSIRIGTWYVKHLMKRFNGDFFLTAAAYNAGPGSVKSWLKKSGDSLERDEFVEAIPYVETRWYVKKVLRSYTEYKRIYGKSRALAALEPLQPGWMLSSVVQEGKTPSR